MFAIQKVRSLALALACAVLLGGCAHPQLMEPGMSLTAVETELGAPDAKVTLESGGTRFVYSLQPMSEQVWWIDFNEKGEVVSRRNVLDREHFALIRPGIDTKETVWHLFGKCAEESHFALVNQDAWMYRFLDEGFLSGRLDVPLPRRRVLPHGLLGAVRHEGRRHRSGLHDRSVVGSGRTLFLTRSGIERKACAFPILSKKGWGQAGRT